MHRHAPDTAVRMRTFAPLAVLVAAGLAGAGRPHPASPGHGGSYAAVFTAPPGTLVMLRTSAPDAAGGTVTETITSAYRTGR